VNEARQDRVRRANKLISWISLYGRQFFLYTHGVSKFELDIRDRLWFIDAYQGKRIYTHYRGYRSWSGLTTGGTLKDLLVDLSDWIMEKNQYLRYQHLGPWPGWYSAGDLWGYGNDNMKILREEAVNLRIIEQTKEKANART